MKTTHVHFARLFAAWISVSALPACGGSKEEPKTPAQQKADDSEDFSEDEVKDSPDWR